jgi:hypothetical protein
MAFASTPNVEFKTKPVGLSATLSYLSGAKNEQDISTD